uniref:Phage tail protein n=1 Tax=Desulfacinum infernum TaxID=35837 RepID=A0A832A5M3_9BACT
MAADRLVPYGAFNFAVEIDGIPVAGFSDVSGLNTEITISEYREGTYPLNHVRKVPGMHKVGDVTLKRGIIDSKEFWDWIKQVRQEGVRAQRNVSVILMDESHNEVQRWNLRGVIPLKWTGPTLAAKGGGDVAMEELVLSAEALELD